MLGFQSLAKCGFEVADDFHVDHRLETAQASLIMSEAHLRVSAQGVHQHHAKVEYFFRKAIGRIADRIHLSLIFFGHQFAAPVWATLRPGTGTGELHAGNGTLDDLSKLQISSRTCSRRRNRVWISISSSRSLPSYHSGGTSCAQAQTASSLIVSIRVSH